MCLPQTLLLGAVHGEGVERWGEASRDGRVQRVGLAFTPEATVGDLLLVMSGQAVRVVVPDRDTPVTAP